MFPNFQYSSRALRGWFRGQNFEGLYADVVLYLIKAKCLPVLLYGVEVCPVSVSDVRSLEFTVKRTMIKLFRTYDSGIINSCKQTCWSTYK